MKGLSYIINLLLTPRDSRGLALFRIAFGAILICHFAQEYFTGTVLVRYYPEVFHFTFPFFHFVKPLSAEAMNALLVAFLFLLVLFTVGFFSRYVSVLCWLIYTYLFLLDVAFYNNHYYLISLVFFLFSISDAGSAWSADSLLKKKQSEIPYWQLLIFRIQFVIVYFYGGISKIINPDWSDNSSTSEMLASSLTKNGIELSNELVLFFSKLTTWGGLFFDLGIGFLLFHRKTRWFAFILIIGFNVTNSLIFNIGIFPWMMIASLLLFIPSLNKEQNNKELHTGYNLKLIVISSYFIFQLIFPFRHLLIKGDAFITGEGYLFSWNMKPGTKKTKCAFTVKDKETGLQYAIEPHDYFYHAHIIAMGKYPWVVPQAARYIRSKAEKWNLNDPQVHVDLQVSINGKEFRPLIDNDTDISSVTYNPWKHNEWINN